MTEQRKMPAVDAFWKAALGDNSRMANLAKAAVTELQACLAAQPAPQRVAVPDGWREKIQQAIDRAAVFDDGGDGADAESARSVVGILSAMLTAAPQPDGVGDGRCPHCFGSGIMPKAAILPEPPDVKCRNCNGTGKVRALLAKGDD